MKGSVLRLRTLRAPASVACILGVLVAACGTGKNVAATLVDPPTYQPKNQTSCHVKKSQDRPLIVEWPGTERTDLSAKLQPGTGLVAVKYVGCEMDVLRRCTVPGNYRWVPTPVDTEQVKMDDVDQLYAQMPMAGPTLEGHISAGKVLRVSTTISGKWVADRPTVRLDELKSDECAGATHVVTGITAGAFELYSQGKADVGLKAPIVGASSAANRESLSRSGKEDRCDSGKSTDRTPPEGCAAPLRLEVDPIACPEGMRFVEDRGCVQTTSAHAAVAVSAPAPVVSAGASGVALLTRDAGKAMLVAAQGQPLDAKWKCKSDDPDMSKRQRDELAALGPSMAIVATGGEFDLRGLGPAWVRLSATAFVLRDGKVRWSEIRTTTDASFEPDKRDFPLVADAPAALRDDVQALLDGLSPKRCAPALLTMADVATLPLPKETLDKAKEAFARDAEGLPARCKEAGTVLAPWRVKLETLVALVFGQGKMGVIEAHAGLKDGAVCLHDLSAEIVGD